MKCQLCGHSETKVVDSRTADNAIRRRRECLKCGERFTTYERFEEVPLMVVKKDGNRQPFDRGKLMAGLLRAVTNRKIPAHEMESIIDDIEKELKNKFQQEVSSMDIGDMVLRRLKDLDKVAYIRFASVYKEFTDVDEFNKELKRLR